MINSSECKGGGGGGGGIHLYVCTRWNGGQTYDINHLIWKPM